MPLNKRNDYRKQANDISDLIMQFKSNLSD